MQRIQILTAVTLVSCLTIFAPLARAAVVNGLDARMLLEESTFEANAVGALVNLGHTCTVSLVSRRIGVTNRHCFISAKDDSILPELRGRLVRKKNGVNHGVILPSTKIGPAAAVGRVRMGRRMADGATLIEASDYYEIREVWWSPSSASEDDWAVVLFDQSALTRRGFPGENFSTFQLADSSYTSSVQLISHAGYSDRFTLDRGQGHTQHDCHVIGRSGAILMHDCANSRGASGGGIWLSGTNWLIAINAYQTCSREDAADDERCSKNGLANGAVPVERFRAVVHSLIAEGN